MRIVFDESTLRQGETASRSITGVVFFDFDGIYFPGDGWNDFPVVVAVWWLDAINKLRRGFDKEVMLRFMDGPYWIAVLLGVGDTILLRCIDDHRGAGVVHEGLINLETLAAQVHRFARQVVSACIRRGLESSDVSLLRKYLPN